MQVESHDRVLVKAVRKMDRGAMDTIIKQAAAAGLDSMQVVNDLTLITLLLYASAHEKACETVAPSHVLRF
jgi:hypothetical protein